MKYLVAILTLYLVAPCSQASSVDIERLTPGELKTISWKGMPVFIYKRSRTEIERLKNQQVVFNKSRHFNTLFYVAQNYGNKFASDLSYGGNSLENLALRSKRDDIFISMGISTYFQCAIEHMSGRGVFFDPCSKTEYTLDGRILNPNNRENYHLLIPPHYYKDGKIYVGSESEGAIPLIDFSPDIAAMNIVSNEKLIKALMWKKPDLVASLLKTNIDTGYETKTGATALHIAASRSNPKVIKALIKRGFNKNHISKKGVTPLQIALFMHESENSATLLKEGAFEKEFCNVDRCAKSLFNFMKQYDNDLVESEFYSYIDNLQSRSITNKAIQGVTP